MKRRYGEAMFQKGNEKLNDFLAREEEKTIKKIQRLKRKMEKFHVSFDTLPYLI